MHKGSCLGLALISRVPPQAATMRVRLFLHPSACGRTPSECAARRMRGAPGAARPVNGPAAAGEPSLDPAVPCAVSAREPARLSLCERVCSSQVFQSLSMGVLS